MWQGLAGRVRYAWVCRGEARCVCVRHGAVRQGRQVKIMNEIISGDALTIVSFLMGENVDKKAIWDLSPHKEKRRLSQNGLYWVILEKIAIQTKTPKAVIHNTNLRHLGLVERIDDRPVYVLLPDTEETEKRTLNATTYHLAPRRDTKQGTDGVTYRYYVMLRGSSDFNVQEMSALVDLCLQDAHALGIDTISPDELAHIRELERQAELRQKEKANGPN